MALDAQMTDANTGEIDREMSAQLNPEQHGALFAHEAIVQDRFPLLCRLKDYYTDTHFEHRELEALISEVERASSCSPLSIRLKSSSAHFTHCAA